MRPNLPFFIARRYLFSKKSTNAINVISIISMVGVAVATMALVIVLSVFNGFHDLVASFFTNFDPQLEVVPVKGKVAAADDAVFMKIRQLPEVDMVSECVQDQALAFYDGQQAMVNIMGVDDNFARMTRIQKILYGDGDFSLQAANLEYGVPGIRLAQTLGMGARWDGFLKIYAPQREGQLTDMASPADGFVTDSLISPGVVFAVNQAKYDRDYLITSIAFARRLFFRQGMVSKLMVKLKPGTDLDAAKGKIKNLAEGRFNVLDLVTPHLHSITGLDAEEHKNNSRLNKVLLFVLAVALHKLPEGIAAGVSLSGDDSTAWSVTLGIALQNVPEGMVVIAPLLLSGVSRLRTLLISLAIGLLEVVGVWIGFGMGEISAMMLPVTLGFAGGAMLYVTSDEKIPETHAHGYQK